MYPNLNAELARKNVKLQDLADHLEIKSLSTLSNKKNGNYDFTLAEAKKIKDYLKTDMSIDELFEEAE